jgi:hypothetical protein
VKTFDLKRVPPPPPQPDAKLCVACKGFRAECIVPVGEASAPMCWLCAHHVADHDCAPGDAATAECECLPHEIYPGRVPPTVDELIQERMRFQHGDVTREMIEKAPPEDLLRGSSFSDACAARVRETVQNMTPRQREILSNGVVTVQHPYERSGASYTGSVKGLKLWCDEPKPARTRVCHCSICGERGHYAKSCPTAHRRR